MPEPTAVRRLTKKTLVTVSHALEQAALAAAEDGPMVVIALFQRLPYFDRERRVYERIAQQATATVVGLVAAQAPEVPAGAYAVLLDEKEELAREWTVVVLTPRFGALLVAEDLEEVQPGTTTLESGRVFAGRTSMRRDEALHEVLRLRDRLAGRLSPAAQDAVEAVVGRVRELPATPGESRADAMLHLFAAQAERDHTRLRTRNPATDLADEPGIRQWSGAEGVTASGVLPVAVLAVRITHAAGGQQGPIGRTATRQQQAAVELLVTRLRPADRAMKASDNDFTLFLPARSHDDAVAFAYQLVNDFAEAAQRSAFLSATVTVALTVTRSRPLPENELRQALAWALERNAPVVTING
ncbi:DICT sensory domain-containing protein [Actinoplanes sp. TFC3]|uniref:DICT sensory domain-containing protein n=1 Tax=Actinoplanes sp. TFC3 TaxID=1710355 RepID=UPI00082A4378|nr:DICT sensory domain-containing protein [Actinoplanes sp. TFC3]